MTNIKMVENFLVGVQYNDLFFEDCTFEDCTFEDCIFKDCIFKDCSFLKGLIKNCKFYNCKFSNCLFSETSIKGIYFENTCMQKIETCVDNARNNCFSKVNITDCILDKKFFGSLNCSDTVFDNCTTELF